MHSPLWSRKEEKYSCGLCNTHSFPFLPAGFYSRQLEHTVDSTSPPSSWRTSQPMPSSFLAELSLCPPFHRKSFIIHHLPVTPLSRVPQDPMLVHLPSRPQPSSKQQERWELGSKEKCLELLRNSARLANRTSMDQSTVQCLRMTEALSRGREGRE